MGFVLLLVMLTWIRLAIMIFMLYWGLTPPSFEDLVVNTFLRLESLPFLVSARPWARCSPRSPSRSAPSRSRCCWTGAST
jgi:hypothetical protein